MHASLSEPLDELKQLLQDADESDSPVEDTSVFAATKVINSFGDALTIALDSGEFETSSLVQFARREFLPLAVCSEFGARIWQKPLGYAGDWRTLEMMYERHSAGVGNRGVLAGLAILDTPPPRAARNRRPLLAKEIAKSVGSGDGAITSLACGPAREIVDVLEQQPGLLRSINLVDLDQGALDFADPLARSRGDFHEQACFRSNLIKVAMGERPLPISDQDLVYSVGLVDYFVDDLVVGLLDASFEMLKPGGRVIIGNFHPNNPSESIMTHVFDWKLIHRTDEQMASLFEQSRFGSCSEIIYEEEGVNLFAIGVRT